MHTNTALARPRLEVVNNPVTSAGGVGPYVGKIVGPRVRRFAAGEEIALRWIPAESVPKTHRVWLKRTVVEIGEELGVPNVVVRFFDLAPRSRAEFTCVPAEDDVVPGAVCVDKPFDPVAPVLGFYARARGEMLVEVIVHELRHVSQFLALSALSDPVWREQEADAFAADYMARRLNA